MLGLHQERPPLHQLLVCVLWGQGGGGGMWRTCSEQVSSDILLDLVFMTKELAEICNTFSKVIFRIILRKISNQEVRTSTGRRNRVEGGGGRRCLSCWVTKAKAQKHHRFRSNNARGSGPHFIPRSSPQRSYQELTACFSFSSLFPPKCFPADGLTWQQEWNLQKQGWRTGGVH